MDIVFLLIPLALALVGIIVWVFMWAVKSDQFEDLEGPAHQILMDDDEPKWDKPKADDQEEKDIDSNGTNGAKKR
jgi:cbb3-type cytochrome oxidase maturation protein